MAPDTPTLHDLSDDDIESRPLEPQPSYVASTGIEFSGLERLQTIPLQEWRSKSRSAATPE